MGNSRSKSQDAKAPLQPEHSKKILSIDDFWANVSMAQHYAVQRNDIGTTYFHHFLISEVSQFPKLVKVIHYTGTPQGFLKSHSSILGTVIEEVLERSGTGSSNFLDVEVGLYLVDDPSYRHLVNPQKAVERARQRLGESEYDPLFNNCEHLVRWALTGVPCSRQTDHAPALLKIAGAYLSELKNIPYRVEYGFSRASYQGLVGGLEKLIIGSSSRLFQHTAGVTRVAMAATASATFGLSLLFETIGLILNSLKKNRLYEDGKITKQDFKLAVGKDVCTSLLSVLASTAGAVAGQILIPVPLLGGVVGAVVGDVVVRILAPMLCELAVSIFSRFAKWFSALSEKINSKLSALLNSFLHSLTKSIA